MSDLLSKGPNGQPLDFTAPFSTGELAKHARETISSTDDFIGSTAQFCIESALQQIVADLPHGNVNTVEFVKQEGEIGLLKIETNRKIWGSCSKTPKSWA